MLLGFVVNPLAGSGGPLALKGSDGLDPALAGGWAAARATRALQGLAGRSVTLLTGAGAMGENLAREAGLEHWIVHSPSGVTSGADTTACVAACEAAGAQLMVVVGGDGTARDVLAAAPSVPIAGVPAGVKMHSSLFATSPAAAAALLAEFARGRRLNPAMAEVLDRDERGQVRLYGQLPTLAHASRQAAKAARPDADHAVHGALAEAEAMVRAAPLCFIGPGLTMLALKTALSGTGTLLGVDVFAHGALIAQDAAQAQLLDHAEQQQTPLLVLGVVGGQGFLLGRGNQQLGPRVLAHARWPPVVIASAAKLAMLTNATLLVDTGDEALDTALSGFVQVRTASRQTMMMRVHAA